MIVVDASALVDVVLDQPSKPWVLSHLTDVELCAPAHQPAEVLSAIARLVRAGRLPADRARDAIVEARSLRQELVPPSREQLLTALALQERVRVLDGLYAALAQERDAPLLTTDRRLARSSLPVAVLAPGTAG